MTTDRLPHSATFLDSFQLNLPRAFSPLHLYCVYAPTHPQTRSSKQTTTPGTLPLLLDTVKFNTRSQPPTQQALYTSLMSLLLLLPCSADCCWRR